MKKIIRLTESDLTRIVKRVIKEDMTNSITGENAVKDGRNNPNWKNLVSKLSSLSYKPKILTFNSYDTPPIPSQSLNWGTTKSSSGKYALGISSADSKMPKQRMSLFNSEDRNNQTEMHNWWENKGYATDGSNISINYKEADKLASDINSFFKQYPPQ